MSFIINPGSGPVENASLADAETNVTALIADTGRPFTARYTGKEHNGRFAFELRIGDEVREVDMPGLPLERVRSEDLLRIPRLYVDGSSWFWGFAVNILTEPPEAV